MEAQRAGADRRTWLTWVVANTLGFGAGGATAGAIARTMGQPHYGVPVSTAGAVLIATRTAGVACAIFGTVVGASQWLVLRRTLERVAWWVPGSAGGWAAAGVVAGVISGFLGGAVTGIGRDVGVWGFIVAAAVGILALGVLPVTFQWMVLRRRDPHARRWLVGAAGAFILAAWVAGIVVRLGMVGLGWLRPEDFPSALSWVLFGVVAGALYGAATGVILERLLPGPSR